MSERKVTIAWEDLAKHLRQVGVVRREENVTNIALGKPRQVLLSLSRETNGHPPVAEHRIEMSRRKAENVPE